MIKTEELIEALARFHFRRHLNQLALMDYAPTAAWESVKEDERQAYLDDAREEARFLSKLGVGGEG